MGQDKMDMPSYRIVTEGGFGEYVEKKSRFIATLRPVRSEEEAVKFIEEMKKKYWDARHNCSAFVIGSRGEITRCSDDGEPSGTAGRPMLEVLTGEGLSDVAAVVTRYFGGVLLGTGGLVRAYTKAMQEGIAACRTATLRFGTRVLLETDYTGVGKIQYILGKEGIQIENSEYTDRVVFQVFILREDKDRILKEITEATAAKCRIEIKESVYMPIADN
ncbi:MAG: YigZ family protein [Lachnospiraceae bacterium]|nr:YigZ family protein [Lachnospiraceae bacterium]